MCNLHPLKTKSPKYCLGIFLDYNFLSDILSAKLTKFAGHFQNLAVCPTDWRFSRRLSLSPQGGAYTRALKSEKLLSPPIPVGGGSVDTNYWCINEWQNHAWSLLLHKFNNTLWKWRKYWRTILYNLTTFSYVCKLCKNWAAVKYS